MKKLALKGFPHFLQCGDKLTHKTQISQVKHKVAAIPIATKQSTPWNAPVTCRCSSSVVTCPTLGDSHLWLCDKCPSRYLHCRSPFHSLFWDWCRPICVGITLRILLHLIVLGAECCRISATKFMKPKALVFGWDFWSSARQRMRNISIADFGLKATTWAF